MSKKLLAVLLSLVCVLSLCACGAKEEAAEEAAEQKQEQAELANPIVETDQKGVLEATGIEIAAPTGAEDVEYSYCKDTDGAKGFAQVEFEYNDDDYCYRIQLTDQTQMVTDDIQAKPDELLKSLSDMTNIGAQLAGMYYEWKAGGTTVVSDRDGVFALNEGKEGFIAWLDPVPGALYSLSMDEDCTQDKLQTMAEMIFVPMQGDVG